MSSDFQMRLKELEKRIDFLEEENEYLRQIITRMPGNICWKDLNGKYAGCNDNVAKLLKLSSPQEFVGLTLYDFCDKKLADTINKFDESIMSEGKEQSIEEEAFDVTGAPAIYLTHKAPLFDRGGKVSGLLCVSLNITHLKNTENALVLSMLKAEAADKAKTEFLRNISHDLRTPFNGILSFSELLLTSDQNPKHREMLECISISTRKLIDIVNEILEFTKTDTEQPPVRKKYFNIRDLTDNIRYLLLDQLKQKNLDFIVQCASNVPEILIGDEVRILRILLNLVGNAIKFTEKGYIKIEIDLTQKNKKAILNLKVTDTGIGIPSDKYDHIFDKFSRLSYSDSSAYEGLGLGLYIVKKYINELGGTIKVNSQIGKSTTFNCLIHVGVEG